MPSEEVKEVMSKLQKANKIMEDLIDAAMADDKISEDEKQLLFSINEHLNEYVRLTISSISDNVITEEESTKLKEIAKHIISHAQGVAMNDQEISDDEKILLENLVKAIKELEE